jgi:hypothetical protein
MLWKLIRHDWLAFKRSPAFNQELLKTIFLGFLVLYFALNFLALGYFMDEIIEKAVPEADTFLFVGKGMFYYFMVEFLMRLLMQKYPALEVSPYLARPISKSTLAHYLLIKSLGSFFNFLPLFAIVPFFFKSVIANQSSGVAAHFIIFAVGMILLVNFGSFLVDRIFKTKASLAMVFASIIIGLLYLDFSGQIGLGPYLLQVFSTIIQSPFLSIIPIITAGLIYWQLHKLITKHAYLEDLSTKSKATEVSQFSFGFSRWFGQAGRLMDLETKLIWRSKRSRTFLILSFVMLSYPLIFIGNPAMDMAGMKIFIGLFVTGMFALNYGQLLLSWNSPHFDLLLTRNTKIEDIFRAKYYLLVASCIVMMICFSVYIFINLELYLIGLVMFLYNIGVSIYMYMVLASYNSKRIDPMKGAVMNYEGIGAAHFLIMIPLFLIPYLIYKAFAIAGFPILGFVSIGVVGILGFIFHHAIIRWAASLFHKNKYKISAAFRKAT